MSRVFSILGYFEADGIDDAFGRLARHFTNLHIGGDDWVLGDRARISVQPIPDDEVVDALEAIPQIDGPLRGVIQQDKSGSRPVDPSFHPGYGRPPADPHCLLLQGGYGDDEDPQEHWKGTCTRCSWSSEAIGIQRVREGVIAEFLVWHHIHPSVTMPAVESTPQHPTTKERSFGVAVIVAAIANIILAAWNLWP